VEQASSLPVSEIPARRFRFKPTRRERYLLMSLAALGLSVAVLWRPIQHCWLTWLVLRAESPAQSLVDGLVASDAHPDVLLNRLWSTEKIPHRLAVMNYLQTHRSSGNALRAGEVSFLEDAARGSDLEAKDLAFTVLATHRHPDLRGLALEQLRDVDPAVRALGLQQLARAGDVQLVPLVIPFLNDPDPRVVAAAGQALGKWTSNNFGIRLSLALPDFKREVTPDTAALQQGVARWMDWWKEHQSDFAASQIELPPASSHWRLPASDFSLEDLTGKQVPLSTFRGKPVLLSFWATTTTNAFAFLSDLAEVQRKNGNRFVILGISLDGTPLANTEGCGDEDEHSGHAEHSHAGAQAAHVHSGHIRGQVEQFVQQQGIAYPVLMDATAELGHRFNALELPTNVILDRAGNVRRRFVGLRSAAVVEAMLAEADEPVPSLQTETK
jgi:peroxiredoxin